MKLVQLTDTHLLADRSASYRGWNTWRSFERVADTALSRHPDCEVLLLTGDLVHDESTAGYRELARFLRRRAQRHGVRVLALPGNHDRPGRLHGALGAACVELGPLIELDGWRLVLLSSHWPGEIRGRYTASTRLQLQSALRRSARPTLVCIHHPPVNIGSVWLDALGLQRGSRLVRDLTGHRQVVAVLSGHVHQAFEAQPARDVQVLATPSTCRQFLPGAREFALDNRPPGYRVCWLDRNGGFTSRVERCPEASQY